MSYFSRYVNGRGVPCDAGIAVTCFLQTQMNQLSDSMSFSPKSLGGGGGGREVTLDNSFKQGWSEPKIKHTNFVMQDKGALLFIYTI